MHTKEPWARNEQRLESSREHGVANDGWCIAEFYGPDSKDNIRRTRACVNAMAGIADPAAFVDKVRELVNCADGYPELNMSNYDADDVSCLNMWGFEVAKRRDALAALLPAE